MKSETPSVPKCVQEVLFRAQDRRTHGLFCPIHPGAFDMKWLKHCVIASITVLFFSGESSARALSARDVSQVEVAYIAGGSRL